MKFSLRDLLLVTVIVALALGWWLDRSRLDMRASRAAKDADSFRALSDSLSLQLQQLTTPVSQAPAPIPPKP